MDNKHRNNTEEAVYSTKDASQQLGVNVYALRRLCNQGLIPHIRRDKRMRRILTHEQLELAWILLSMKKYGFTGDEIRRYSRLYRLGKKTERERLAILTTRKHQLRQEIELCEAGIDFIERQEEIAEAKR